MEGKILSRILILCVLVSIGVLALNSSKGYVNIPSLTSVFTDTADAAPTKQQIEVMENIAISTEPSTPVSSSYTATSTTSLSLETIDVEVTVLIPKTPMLDYIEIIDSCGAHHEGTCVNVRSGPGRDFPAVAKLRSGITLRVSEIINADGLDWYKIQLDKSIKFPERVTTDWYVAAGDYVRPFTNEGDAYLSKDSKRTSKRIVVDISEQMLYAYDGEDVFMEQTVSTGLKDTPTPIGTFTIFKKTPSRYMQGPLDGISDDFYDLPGVPWDLYFTADGAAIHGAYWHNNFGKKWSHGCVNLPVDKAQDLYLWADVGTRITVKE